MKRCERCGKSFKGGNSPSPVKIPAQYKDGVCAECLKALASPNPDALVEGEDYFFEYGLMVFTSAYLLKRGYCCGSGCRFCPY